MTVSRDAITKALNRKRFAWVDEVMKEVLPTDIYGGMHSADLNDQLSSTHWLHENGYHVKDVGDGVVQIFRGIGLVRQTKLVLELADSDELLSVMEVVKDNVNIPPPPWQPKLQ